MSSTTWVRRLFGRNSQLASRPGGSDSARGRLRLESLEARWVPASFVVRTIGDDPSDTNSIRYAIANLEAGPNDITFAPYLAGQTIALTTSNGGELAIGHDVSIIGPGADLLTISGSNTSRVFNIASGVTASITGITITSGMSTNGLGGAVLNAGNATFTAVAITDSVAQGQHGGGGEGGGGGGAGVGGAVFNSGSFTLVSSTVSGNQAIGGNGARGGFSYAGGDGGGPNGGAGSQSGSNGAGGLGGIYSGGGGGNNPGGTAGGAGGFGGGGGGGGDGAASGSGGPGGFGAGSGGGGDNGIGGGGGGGGGAGLGGGVFNAAGGTVVIINSTIAENIAEGGDGGGAAGGNSIGGNGGSGFGAALFSNGGTIRITSTTLGFNSSEKGSGVTNGGAQAGGVYANAGTITLNSSIVGKNKATTNFPDVTGNFIDGGFNLIGDASGSAGFTPSTITGADPLLNPLGNSGGSTRTLSLRAGSLALQNGDPNNGILADQRGGQRGPSGLNAGATPDIGAWEATSSFLVTSVGVDSSIPGTIRGGFSWANVSSNPIVTNATSNVIQFDTAGAFAIRQTIALSIVRDVTVGPSALLVTGAVVVNGPTGAVQGVTITRDTAWTDLRLYYIAPSGSLTLNNLTLSDGVARGSDAGAGGGGGAGLGGAVYNRGTFSLQAITLSGNTATGGEGTPGNGEQVGGGGGGGLNGPGAEGIAFGAGGDGGGPNVGSGGSVGTNGGNGGFGGGGGGGGFNGGAGGNGGFGGGGGARGFNGGAGGNGGFGGGGGVGSSAGLGGFGGGNRAASGGGGAGFGGAIFNDAGTVTITNSTLAGNSAVGGSGGNAGKGYGGAIFNRSGVVTTTNATIANNSAERGGGIFNLGDGGAGSVTLVNTIVAGTANAATDFDSQSINAGSVMTGGTNNLIQRNAATGGYSGAATQFGVDPLLDLAGVANHSGPTSTIALRPGSPAADAGTNTAITAPPFIGPLFLDQRRMTRIAGPAVDLGAFETQLALVRPAAPITGVEGASTNIPLGSFSDLTPGTAIWNVSVNWGDGTAADAFTVAVQGSLGTRPHTFDYPGSYTVAVTVLGSLGNAASTTFTVDVSDPPVEATGGFTIGSVEGSASFSQIVAAFTDPGGPESLSEYSASIDWGDGSGTTVGTILDFGSNNYGVFGEHTYQDAGTFPITVTILHHATPPRTVTSNADVADPPLNAVSGYSYSSVEGQFALEQIVASFTDPGGPEAVAEYTASIDWGDGTAATVGSISFNGSIYEVSGSHAYQSNGSFPIAVTIGHHATTPRVANSTATVDDPAIIAAGDFFFTAVEGAVSTVQTVSRFLDPGGPELVSEYSATIDWGDGTNSSGIITPSGSGLYSVNGSHTYQNNGTFSIAVTIRHHATAPQTVTSTAGTIDPSVIATGGFAFLARQSVAPDVQQLAAFTDPGGPELVGEYTAEVNWGDGTITAGSIAFASGAYTVSGTHTYMQEGLFPITITIGHHATTPHVVHSTAFVSNSPLVATGGFTINAVEGTLTTSQTLASFIDPSGAEPVQNYAASIDWGDGTAPTLGNISLASNTFTVAGAHSFATHGNFTVVITITHNGADAVFVADAAVVVDPLLSAAGGFTLNAVEGVGSLLQTVATFTDPGGPESIGEYTAEIAWGDGTESPGTIAFNGTQYAVIGSHSYTNNGTYSISVTIGHHQTQPQVVMSAAQVSGQNLLMTGGVTVSATEGTLSSVQTLATFIDPHGSDPVDAYSATIDWGDGTTPSVGTISLESGAFIVIGSHTYLNEGSFTITVTVTHAGVSQSVTDTASVANADSLVGTVGGVAAHRSDSYSGIVATFANAGYPDHEASAFAATIDWGDGTTSFGTINNVDGTLNVEGEHTYSTTGAFPISVMLSNVAPGTTSATALGSARVTAPFAVIGAMSGGPEVRVVDAQTKEVIGTFIPYGPGFTGGITVAQGDVNGDGFADIITGAGFGGASHVKVFDGLNGRELFSFFAYDPTFRNGVYVAAGDVNSDGFADIVTGAGFTGAPHVKVFDGRNLKQLDSFFAYDSSFRNGVYVSSADVNGDGRADIITGAGPGGGPHVKVFDAASVATMKSFFAHSAEFSGGIFVTGGDVDGDGFCDIITGAGSGGSGHVQVFSGKNGEVIRSFFAYPPLTRDGVTVAACSGGDGKPTFLLVGATSGDPASILLIDPSDLTGEELYHSFEPGYLAGVFVG